MKIKSPVNVPWWAVDVSYLRAVPAAISSCSCQWHWPPPLWPIGRWGGGRRPWPCRPHPGWSAAGRHRGWPTGAVSDPRCTQGRCAAPWASGAPAPAPEARNRLRLHLDPSRWCVCARNENEMLGFDPLLHQVDGLMQRRRNSSAYALELLLYCIKPTKCGLTMTKTLRDNIAWNSTAWTHGWWSNMLPLNQGSCTSLQEL